MILTEKSIGSWISGRPSLRSKKAEVCLQTCCCCLPYSRTRRTRRRNHIYRCRYLRPCSILTNFLCNNFRFCLQLHVRIRESSLEFINARMRYYAFSASVAFTFPIYKLVLSIVINKLYNITLSVSYAHLIEKSLFN